jgi:hypothetical protein
MARGFESKDVEFQQAEATNSVATPARHALTVEERRARDGRQTITLSLARARAELASATSPVHRRMLEQAITALEATLASFPE